MRSNQAKSATAFRTISEVATDLDVPQHVLRFWETRFPQIRPLKRGGGRRYYRPEDVELLRVIQRLLYKEGYTIRGVQRLLREHRSDLLVLAGGGGSSRGPEGDAVGVNAVMPDDPSGHPPEEIPPEVVLLEPEPPVEPEPVFAGPPPAPPLAPPPPAPPPPAMAPGVRTELESLLAELKGMKALLAMLH